MPACRHERRLSSWTHHDLFSRASSVLRVCLCRRAFVLSDLRTRAAGTFLPGDQITRIASQGRARMEDEVALQAWRRRWLDRMVLPRFGGARTCRGSCARWSCSLPERPIACGGGEERARARRRRNGAEPGSRLHRGRRTASRLIGHRANLCANRTQSPIIPGNPTPAATDKRMKRLCDLYRSGRSPLTTSSAA